MDEITENPGVPELEPRSHRPDAVAGALDESDNPWTELDENFTSTEVQQLRWAHGKTKRTRKRRRIKGLVAEAAGHLGKPAEAMGDMPDEFRRP
jgi:hypothetical protein